MDTKLFGPDETRRIVRIKVPEGAKAGDRYPLGRGRVWWMHTGIRRRYLAIGLDGEDEILCIHSPTLLDGGIGSGIGVGDVVAVVAESAALAGHSTLRMRINVEQEYGDGDNKTSS